MHSADFTMVLPDPCLLLRLAPAERAPSSNPRRQPVRYTKASGPDNKSHRFQEHAGRADVAQGGAVRGRGGRRRRAGSAKRLGGTQSRAAPTNAAGPLSGTFRPRQSPRTERAFAARLCPTSQQPSPRRRFPARRSPARSLPRPTPSRCPPFTSFPARIPALHSPVHSLFCLSPPSRHLLSSGPFRTHLHSQPPRFPLLCPTTQLTTTAHNRVGVWSAASKGLKLAWESEVAANGGFAVLFAVLAADRRLRVRLELNEAFPRFGSDVERTAQLEPRRRRRLLAPALGGDRQLTDAQTLPRQAHNRSRL